MKVAKKNRTLEQLIYWYVAIKISKKVPCWRALFFQMQAFSYQYIKSSFLQLLYQDLDM